MIDVVATLCLLDAPDICARRWVPVGAASCEEARAAAAPRLEAWSYDHAVDGVGCGAMDVAPLAFEEVAPGLFVHLGAVALAEPGNGGDIGNIAFVVGEEAVAAIDAGGTRALGEGVVAAIRARTDRPIRHLVLTHMHPDHVLGGTALVDAGAEVWGHAGLAAALGARVDGYIDQGREQVGAAFLGSGVPPVDRAVEGQERLDLGGGRVLEVLAWPAAHTAADVSVLDGATGTLIAGDLVVDGHIPTLDGSLTGWLEVLDAMERLGVQQVVPGHGGPVRPWPEAAQPVRAYLEMLAADVRALIADGVGLREASETAAGAARGDWRLFDDHNPRNATAAYTELEWE